MAEEKKHIYQSATLGVPALQMVLVHARNDAQNAAMRPSKAPVQERPALQASAPMDTQQAVRKIIEHLEEMENTE